MKHNRFVKYMHSMHINSLLYSILQGMRLLCSDLKSRTGSKLGGLLHNMREEKLWFLECVLLWIIQQIWMTDYVLNGESFHRPKSTIAHPTDAARYRSFRRPSEHHLARYICSVHDMSSIFHLPLPRPGSQGGFSLAPDYACSISHSWLGRSVSPFPQDWLQILLVSGFCHLSLRPTLWYKMFWVNKANQLWISTISNRPSKITSPYSEVREGQSHAQRHLSLLIPSLHRLTEWGPHLPLCDAGYLPGRSALILEPKILRSDVS